MQKNTTTKTKVKTGTGKFYRIEVSPKREFITFRTQDVGRNGGLERVAGKRKTGSWGTVAWLVDKEKALVKNGKLFIKDAKMKTVLKQIKGDIEHLKGDIFSAMNIKPTKPQPARKKIISKVKSRTKAVAKKTKSKSKNSSKR